MEFRVSKKAFLELPQGKWGRFACVVIGAFFGIGASWLLIALLVNGKVELDRFWVAELLAMFAVFGWGLLVWGIATPLWINRVIQRASAYIMLAITILFLPIAFEFLVLCFREKL